MADVFLRIGSDLLAVYLRADRSWRNTQGAALTGVRSAGNDEVSNKFGGRILIAGERSFNMRSLKGMGFPKTA